MSLSLLAGRTVVHIVVVSFSSFNFTVILKLQFLKMLRQTIDYSLMSSDCLFNPCNCSTLSSIYFALLCLCGRQVTSNLSMQ